jgi:hypothetical protein
MKMNSAQIERILHQLDVEAIPAEHPVLLQLERLFGDHTYFLDGNGLHIVEPVEAEARRLGVVVTLANWADAHTATLQPHEPQSTELTVDLESEIRH